MGTKWYGAKRELPDFGGGGNKGLQPFIPGGPRKNLGGKGKGPKITKEMRQAIVRRLDGKKKGGIRKNLPVGGMVPIGGNKGGMQPIKDKDKQYGSGPRTMARGTKWYK